ncbi:MAG: glycosyltransferase family 39 protein [Planctomycetaceae bacterium]|nr:glycosyltransferase family 39 protein [Planctomycetaceae bacterium]
MAMWQYGSFDLYCVNPPLMRAVATLPILFMAHEELWGDFEGAPQPRPEFVLGAQFVESHPDRWRQFLVAARWALLPFTALGALFCYLWAAELYGRKAGLVALTLWCFSPNILAWSSVIGTDGIAATIGLGAGYLFWRWLRSPTWGRAAVAGLFLGLALLSKMTWIVLFAVWPLLWLLWRITAEARGTAKPRPAGMTFVLLLGLYVLNLGYFFEGTFKPLGEFQFESRLLSGVESSVAARETDASEMGNRFTGSPLHRLPIPLPRPFIQGMDLQKVDFEKGRPSYLFGRWSERGWWYYYLIGLCFKVPLGTWGLGVLATIGFYKKSRSRGAVATAEPDGLGQARHIDVVVVLAPALTLLIFVSSQDGFSHHFRYLLPAFPFMFVWLGQAVNWIGAGVLPSSLVVGALGWSVLSSLSVYPHSMSYFNEIAGGPAGGHRIMLGSSHSWSQDDFYLKKWIESHPDVDSPYMVLERSVSLERLGIRSRGESPSSSPAPGWHVMSVQQIYGPESGYRYFLQFKPVARVGYSIYVYKIDPSAANRVRRSMGLPAVPVQSSDQRQLIADMVAARDSGRSVAVALFVPDKTTIPTEDEIYDVITEAPRMSLNIVSEDDIRRGELGNYDVLVVPGGNAGVQGSALGSDGKDAVRRFVHEGGGYVGICAGCFLASANHEQGLKLINAQVVSGQRFVPNEGYVSASFRGWGQISVEMTSEGYCLFGTSKRSFTLDYTGGPVLSRANEPDLPDYEPLAYYRSEVSKYPFQKDMMVHSPAIAATRFGGGTVVVFSAHPESNSEYEHLLTDAIRACAD